MDSRKALVTGLFGGAIASYAIAIAPPFDAQVQYRLGDRTGSAPAWLVPAGATFQSLEPGYGGLKLPAALLGTCLSAGAMTLARKFGAEEKLRQKQWRHREQVAEHQSAAQAAYEMALAEQRYKTLLQADQVSFEGEVEGAYMQALGIDPAAAYLPGTSLEQVTDPRDKVQGQEEPAIADTASTPPSTPSSSLPNLTNYPSVLIYGSQGSGKTTFAESEIQRRLRAGHRVVALDPHAKFGGWKGCEVIGAGMDYLGIDAKLGWFAGEVRRRYELIAKQPDPKFQPLTVVVDEFTNWASRCDNAGEFFKAALSDIRKAECYVLIISHTRTLPGLGDAKGMASLRDAALLEIELLGQIDPATGEAVPKFEAFIKLPGQGQGDRSLIKIPRSQPPIDPRKLDPEYFERTYRLEFEMSQPPDTAEPDEPSAEPLNRSNSESPSDSEQRFTALGLAREQAIALIKQLRPELNQTQVIERLWQVSKGGSEGWRKARKEYQELMGE